MKQVEYIAPTKRRSMTTARATRIFLRENGRCYLCGNQIRDGEKWQVEHPEELADGGSDNDADLRVAHDRCHKPKTAASRNARAKRNRRVTKSWTGKSKRGLHKPDGYEFDWKLGRYVRDR